jgi:diguanylate cyclase (GGDEF)-like protein
LARFRATPATLTLLFWAALPAGWGALRTGADLGFAPGVILTTGLLCGLIARAERSRRPAATAWLLLALGHLFLLVGYLLHEFSAASAGSAWHSPTTDLVMVGFHLAVLAAVVLLLHGLTPRWFLGQWWDGLVAALGVLALGLALLDLTAFGPDGVPAAPARWITTVAGNGIGRPGLDLLLLTAVVALTTAARFSLPYLWWIPAGLAVMTAADLLSSSWYPATGQFPDRLLRAVWLLGPMMIAHAADSRLTSLSPTPRAPSWSRNRREAEPPATGTRLPGMGLLPGLGGLTSVVLVGVALVTGEIGRPASLTALTCLVIGISRLGLSVWQLRGSLDALRLDRTDRVTGLANRQAVSEVLAGDLTTVAVPVLPGRGGPRAPGRTPPTGPATQRRDHLHPLRTPPWGNRSATGPADRTVPAGGFVADGTWIALLLVDLDRFKDVNDALGHGAGDRLLAAVGARLNSVLRPDQLLARLGGDEFAVVLPGVERAGAEQVGAAVRDALVRPFEIDGTRLHISASVGVATACPPRDDPTDLLRQADVAMYRAKRGRAGLAVYDPLLDHQGPERLRRIDELRSALDQGQLEVHLQPQVDLRGGQTVGVEALARWRHPHDGVLLPEDFLPLAAATGLMRPVARLVLDQALAACLTWWAEGHRVPVSVNLTAEDLAGHGVRELVDETLRRYALPGSALHVEITEDALLTERTRVAELLARWRADGVAVSIDDYGTGYSSLAYLRELPIDEIKLDQVFIADLSRRTTATIVRHTVAMAHGLRLRVVAEGIEDEATARTLAEMGCDTGQGLYFGPAMSPEDFLTRLRKGAV